MTNPTNAVEKPATGCGCVIANTDASVLCPSGRRLHAATGEAWRRYEEASAGDAVAYAWLDYKNAREAWRTHVEAAQ